MNATLVLSILPPTAAYREVIEAKLGADVYYVTLGELRAKGTFSMVRWLGSQRLTLAAAAFEDEQSSGMAPLMTILLSFANAKRRTLIHPDGAMNDLSPFAAPLSVIKLIGATVGGYRALVQCRNEMAGLMTLPRLIPGPLNDGPALYLNADVWFGAKVGGSIGHIAGVLNDLARRRGAIAYSANGFPLIAEPVDRRSVTPLNVHARPAELNFYRFHHHYTDHVLADLKEQPAFVYQRLALGNFSGVRVSRELGVPLVIEYNGSEAWVARHWGTRPLRFHDEAVLAEEVCFRHAHLVVTVSQTLGDELTDRGVEADRIVIAPNGFDPTRFDPARFDNDAIATLRRRLGIDPPSLVATFVGTFGKWHGAEKFAEAAVRLCERYTETVARHDLRFLFVGDGLMAPEAKRIVAGTAAEARTTFSGLVPQEDAPLYLAASDIFVSPHVPNADGSKFFGSPTKLFEYMAMARPVVASDLEQIGQILAPGMSVDALTAEVGDRVALLTKPGDADELAVAFARLADAPAVRKGLGENGRRRALERHTWQAHVDLIMAGLGRVVPGS